VNLGCGTNIVDQFLNIDFFTTQGIDYGADLRFPLLLKEASVDGIICEHTLEHLSYSEVDRLLKECFRILKPGAVLRIVVPDLFLFMQNYCNKNRGWFSQWEELMFVNSEDKDRAKRRLVSDLEAISFVTQEYGHISCWDYETLDRYLCRAGFCETQKRQYREGNCEILLEDLDAADRKFVSVYVEAVK
jgi:predicted SAM-dependent methyltransferase